MGLGSFSVTRYKISSEFFLRPSFRNSQFVGSLTTLLVLCGFFLLIVVKARAHLSVVAIGWMAVSMFWMVSLFRMVLRNHLRLQMVLKMDQVDMNDIKSPLGVALHIVRDISMWALFFGVFSIFAMLMAITLILPKH
jgi:hypothetical protein